MKTETPHLDALPTLTERSGRPVPKPESSLRARIAEIQEADRAWWQCCRMVDARDQHCCRCCGRRVRKTLARTADRAEHHHLTPRSLAPQLRTDSRGVILVCARCHEVLTRHHLRIVTSHYFTVDGQAYPNADEPIRFVPG